METLRSWPYPLTVAALFVIVLTRANATYWVGRGARSGADRTRLQPLMSSAAFLRAARLLERWGAPLVTACFLTVGIQTVVNLAAGATRMSMRRYLPAVALGSAVWAFLYATVGFATFTAWRRLYEQSPPAAVVVVGVLVVALIAFVRRQLGHRTARQEHQPPSTAEECRVAGGPERGPTSG
ncbi:MAG TPA: VTT domain-containing protein [Propionibacteriaceae bacterium]